MSDYYYNATPPGGYVWDDEDYERQDREEDQSEADLVIDSAIEAARLNKKKHLAREGLVT